MRFRRGGGVVRRRRRRTWAQRLVITGGTLGSLGFAVSAAGLGYLYHRAEGIPRVELSHVLAEPLDGGEPLNVLMVGVDDPEGLDEDDPIFNERDTGVLLADTIMILRIDPQENDAVLMSIPRDLWVTFPDTQEQARINSALWRGDGRSDVLIQLLNEDLGIPIHHYVQVNLAGFKDIVEAVGGVPVYFERPARDRYSGLHVYETGCVMLDADQALGYARSRHYEEYIDGEWETEARSDLARVERQQDFLRRIADRAVSQGVRNFGTMDRMLRSTIDSVTVDDDLTLEDMRDLAQRFSSFDPQELESITLPTQEDTVGAAQILRMDEYQAESVLDIFRGESGEGLAEAEPDDEDEPESEHQAGTDPDRPSADAGLEVSEVLLTVMNGSGESGQATSAGADLSEAGFRVVGMDNADQFGLARTEVRYPADAGAEAELVERWLVAGADLVETSEVSGVTVVTGSDWEGVLDEPRPVDTSDDTTGATGDDGDGESDGADFGGDLDSDADADADGDADGTSSSFGEALPDTPLDGLVVGATAFSALAGQASTPGQDDTTTTTAPAAEAHPC